MTKWILGSVLFLSSRLSAQVLNHTVCFPSELGNQTNDCVASFSVYFPRGSNDQMISCNGIESLDMDAGDDGVEPAISGLQFTLRKLGLPLANCSYTEGPGVLRAFCSFSGEGKTLEPVCSEASHFPLVWLYPALVVLKLFL